MKISTRRALVAAVALTGAFVMTGGAGAATVQISAQEFSFTPQPATATAGDTVRWTNNGTVTHNVTVEGQGPSGTDLDLGDFSPGQQLSRLFATPGTFRFYCHFHGAPGGLGMSGTVTVRDAGTTSTTLTSTSTTSTSTTSTSTSTSSTSTSTSTTVAPTSTTSTSTSTTSTTVAPTTTTSTSTSTSLPATTTTTLNSSQCADLRASRATFNAQNDANAAAIRAAGLSPSQQAAVLAQLEASRAQGNAQIDAALAANNCR